MSKFTVCGRCPCWPAVCAMPCGMPSARAETPLLRVFGCDELRLGGLSPCHSPLTVLFL